MSENKRIASGISETSETYEQYEIERKFLIKYPDIETLEHMQKYSCTGIIQTYLKTERAGEVVRVRQSDNSGKHIYTETVKMNVSDIRRIEKERRITPTEYNTLIHNADSSLKQIRKNRHSFCYLDQVIEIDIYPFWRDCAILEVELQEECQEIVLPDFIQVIREVTGDSRFSNRGLADKIPADF